MISTYPLYEQNLLSSVLESFAYNAIIEDNFELVETICNYIDTPNNLFESQLNDYFDQDVLSENLIKTTRDQEYLNAAQHSLASRSLIRDNAGKILKGQDVLNSDFDPDLDPKSPNNKTLFKAKGIFRRAVGNIGKGRAVQYLKRGLIRALRTRIGQPIVKLGIKAGRHMFRSGHNLYNKSLDNHSRYVIDRELENRDINKINNGPGNKVTKFIKKSIYGLSKGAVAGVLPGVAATLTANPIAYAASAGSAYTSLPGSIHSTIARHSTFRGAKRMSTGKAIHNFFKGLRR